MSEQPTPQPKNTMLQSMGNLAPVRYAVTVAHDVHAGLIDAREKWEQFREDYVEGGGIRYGLRRAVQDGFKGALLFGTLGGAAGLGIPLGLDILNAASAPTSPATMPIYSNPDAGYTDAWFPTLSIYLGIGGGIVGGVIFFFEGFTAPAREGARYRRGNYFGDFYR